MSAPDLNFVARTFSETLAFEVRVNEPSD